MRCYSQQKREGIKIVKLPASKFSLTACEAALVASTRKGKQSKKKSLLHCLRGRSKGVNDGELWLTRRKGTLSLVLGEKAKNSICFGNGYVRSIAIRLKKRYEK